MTMYESFRLMARLERAKRKGSAHLLECLFSEKNLCESTKKDKGDIIEVEGIDYEILEHTKNLPSIPLVADIVHTKAQIHPSIFHDYLGRFPRAKTPIGMVSIDSKAIEAHWLDKAKFMSQSKLKAEIRWRKRLPRFFIQTLRNPHEIWLSYRNNEWSYVFIRKFNAEFDGVMQDIVLVAIVPVETLSVKTYYGEKENLETAEKKYRRVYLIHKR